MDGMKLGMPTLIELEGLMENIDLCKELGLDFIEINMNMPQFQIDKLSAQYLKEVQLEHNIYFTIHLPDDLDIGHFNPRIREAQIEFIEEMIEFANEAHIPILNMHMNRGTYVTLPTQKIELYEKYYETYIEHISKAARRIDQALQSKDVKLTIENTGIYNKAFIVEAVEVFLNYENCYLTWDIGHDYSSGKQDEYFMTKHIDKIRHMHMHDAIGKQHHLELYTGEMDLKHYFELAELQGWSCVIETKTVEALRNSIGYIK